MSSLMTWLRRLFNPADQPTPSPEDAIADDLTVDPYNPFPELVEIADY